MRIVLRSGASKLPANRKRSRQTGRRVGPERIGRSPWRPDVLPRAASRRLRDEPMDHQGGTRLAARLHGWLKRSAAGAAWLGTRPLRGLYACHRALAGDQRAIASWSQTMAVLPGLTGAYARRAFYRSVLAEVEDDCLIGFGVLFSHPQTRIGRGVYIGPYAVLGKVTIERDVLIGSQVSITNGAKQHGIERLDVPIREQPGHWPRVTIGEDSWLGDRAIVMASVGRHCVVG